MKKKSRSVKSRTGRWSEIRKWVVANKMKLEVLLLILLLGALVLITRQQITHLLRIIDWRLLKDYIALVVTWPVAVLVIGIMFISRFENSIRIFLEKIDRFKAPGVELSQQQSTTVGGGKVEEKAVENLETKANDGSVTLTKEQIDQLVSMYEEMDFKFLNLHLVQNTKIALQTITQIEARKTIFLQAYQVPSHVANPIVERQAILSTLTEAGLIDENNDILKVTEKGLRFLNFIGMQAGDIR